MTSIMRRVTSYETFRKSTQPPLPTLPEKGVLDIQVQQLLETIDEILEELGQPTRSFSYKNTFLETFMQKVDDRTTQLLNERFIQ
jgi:hypothetical protein